MRSDHRFVCPETREPLALVSREREGDDVIEGELVSPSGRRYPVIGGLPRLVHPSELHASERASNAWYEHNHADYDACLPLTARTFGVDETEQRERIIDLLQIQPGQRILETGAGTGRDSVLLSQRLGPGGELHVTDLFDKMLDLSRPKLAQALPRVVHCVANAIHLPYPDRYFDACFHFGGLNTFSDKKKAFAEISRVVKPGGRVVVGDESIAPWLRDTEFGAILMNANPHYAFVPPLADMHVSARDVCLRFIMGGAFYVVSYSVGEGEPEADFDFEIPGPRGGTLSTRLHGRLEGVSAEAVRLARAACAESGLSMHRWLDAVVREAATRQLKVDSAGEGG
jgi:ubiquinone/menaquinone biosynthesis C-methylase UbiE/uncharacterized protein YbaR (Trm112 family)